MSQRGNQRHRQHRPHHPILGKRPTHDQRCQILHLPDHSCCQPQRQNPTYRPVATRMRRRPKKHRRRRRQQQGLQQGHRAVPQGGRRPVRQPCRQQNGEATRANQQAAHHGTQPRRSALLCSWFGVHLRLFYALSPARASWMHRHFNHPTSMYWPPKPGVKEMSPPLGRFTSFPSIELLSTSGGQGPVTMRRVNILVPAGRVNFTEPLLSVT